MVASIHMVALPIVTPVVLASPNSTHREVWKIVEVANTHENMTTGGDVKVTVSSSSGVDVAWSTNITEYFRNIAYWNGTLGYKTYMEWLNGTSTLPYHWGEMDWYVSEGSLTSITWDEIKYWWDMYSDTGGSVTYKTFMGNTYMADCNLTDPGNDPDIVGVVPWSGSSITIKDLVVPANMTVHIVFKIVIIEPGAYAFDLTSPNPLLEISPSSWRVGGVATILVPYDYSTIQAAIDAASPSDTIIVYDGTYPEDLSIQTAKTDLEIRSEEGASVTIKGVQNVPVASWPLAIPNIEVDASGVKIHGFTIEGPDHTSGYYSSGIVIGASGVEIYDNSFKVTPADNLDEISQAIQTFHKNAKPGVDISGLNIHHNNFTHLSAGVAGYEGIYINLDEGTDVAAVQYNNFTGNVVRAITTERSVTTVEGNVITTDLVPGLPGGYQGLNVGGVNAGNVMNVSVTNNVINGSASGRGFMYGIKLGFSSTSTFTNVAVTGNTIQMNEVGVFVKFSADGVKVNLNNIYGNPNYGVSNTDSATLDAEYNWWGNETGPQHSVFNPLGTGENVSDNVDFRPWLIQLYPPAVPVSELYVDPQLAQCWTGFNETFEVKVILANVQLLYGFDFKLTWDSTLLNLTFASYSELWGAYPDTYPWQNTINNTLGKYHLALSGTGDVTPFDGNATLATLTFSITSEPVYPTNFTSDLALVDTLLTSTKNLTEPEPILHVVYNGTYMCNSTLPKIALGQSIYTIERTPYEAGETKKFDVDIKVTDVVNLEAFDFKLTYDPYLLKFGNEWQIHVTCANGWVVWNDTQGSVFGHADGISPLVNGTATLATVKFQVRRGFVWNTVNSSRSCPLEFSYTNLTRTGNTPIEHEAINGTYRYKPVPGDLDMSGSVDILDLAAAAHAFGLDSGDPSWEVYWFANVYVDDTINILDIVIIARNFGRTEPEP